MIGRCPLHTSPPEIPKTRDSLPARLSNKKNGAAESEEDAHRNATSTYIPSFAVALDWPGERARARARGYRAGEAGTETAGNAGE